MGLPLVDEDSGDRMFWASSRCGDHELVAMIPFGPVGPLVIYMDTYTASANVSMLTRYRPPQLPRKITSDKLHVH